MVKKIAKQILLFSEHNIYDTYVLAAKNTYFELKNIKIHPLNFSLRKLDRGTLWPKVCFYCQDYIRKWLNPNFLYEIQLVNLSVYIHLVYWSRLYSVNQNMGLGKILMHVFSNVFLP